MPSNDFVHSFKETIRDPAILEKGCGHFAGDLPLASVLEVKQAVDTEKTVARSSCQPANWVGYTGEQLNPAGTF